MVIERFSNESSTISGTATYQFVEPRTSRPNAHQSEPQRDMHQRADVGRVLEFEHPPAEVRSFGLRHGRIRAGTGRFVGHARAPRSGCVDGGELELHGESGETVGVARSQPFDGAERQMIGEHHPAHLGDGQFAGQWFVWKALHHVERGADEQRRQPRRRRATTESRPQPPAPGRRTGPANHRALRESRASTERRTRSIICDPAMIGVERPAWPRQAAVAADRPPSAPTAVHRNAVVVMTM